MGTTFWSMERLLISTIDISRYGLLAGQDFAIQLKLQVGSVINVAREVPIAVTPRMALR